MQSWVVAALSLALLVMQDKKPGTPPGPPPGKPPGAPAQKDDKAKPKKKIPADALRIRVTTVTGGLSKYANTSNARIYVMFNGDEEQKARLTNKNKPFQRGATDTFEFRLDLAPEKIESFRLLNESVDMWRCERVSLQFFKNGKESPVYRFQPAEYLSTGKERKAFSAKPHVEYKLRIKLDEPKKKKDDPSEADKGEDKK